MNRFHIGIGNNLFPLIPGNDLRGCINDAHQMKSTLDAHFGAAVGGRLIENSTRAQFNEAMEAAIAGAATGTCDYITISISTHGLIYGTGTPDNFLQALVFSDFDGKVGDGLLADVAFKSFLDRIPRSVGVEIWIDACHSATATRAIGLKSRSLISPKFDPTKHSVKPSAITSKSRTPEDNIVVWSACRDDETAADQWSATLKEGWGAFTNAFCSAYNEAGNGATRRQIMSQLLLNLLASGVAQHPQISFQQSATT